MKKRALSVIAAVTVLMSAGSAFADQVCKNDQFEVRVNGIQGGSLSEWVGREVRSINLKFKSRSESKGTKPFLTTYKGGPYKVVITSAGCFSRPHAAIYLKNEGGLKELASGLNCQFEEAQGERGAESETLGSEED